MRYVNCHPPFAAIFLSGTGQRPFCCNPALLAMGFCRTSGTLLLVLGRGKEREIADRTESIPILEKTILTRS